DAPNQRRGGTPRNGTARVARRVVLALGTVLAILTPADLSTGLEIDHLAIPYADAGVGPLRARRHVHLALAQPTRPATLVVLPVAAITAITAIEGGRAVLIELDRADVRLLHTDDTSAP